MLTTPDPYINIGNFAIRWYSVFFGLAYLVLALQLNYFVKKEKAPGKDLPRVLLLILIFGVIGARLAHVLFYEFEYYTHNLTEILEVWKGGLASHGGAIGVAIAIIVYSKYFGSIYYWWWFDKLAIAVPISVALIRLGNFFNGELYGIPSKLPWAVNFNPAENFARHPVQLYESITYLICAGFLYYLYNKKTSYPLGYFFGLSLAIVNASRFLLEFIKHDNITFGGLITSQLLNLLFIIIGLVVLRLSLKGKFN